ncbi:Zn(2)-C6 fungal-type domain-containing protein [Mycena indigotica]|uniref:Zn(2)-C6 fungal-type domain-containing protein n=1 Tax=Mycena indigotica TaxID=2126181 RepID=A0A8H6S091_9AGAR|nr:Zn(2)-C6 fungal-type domain-containing protein [Mycena indigotica]KAF7290271.1 Zn(2)-C6 fungal-type domain-containing protein [Mycena indigotica]
MSPSPSQSPPPMHMASPAAVRLPSYQELVALSGCALDAARPGPVLRPGPPQQRYATLPPLRVPPRPLTKADLARYCATSIPPPPPASPYGDRPSPVAVSAPTPTSSASGSPPASAYGYPAPAPPHEPELRFAHAARRAKKQALSCFFCRERKIACGRPDDGTVDGRCNQCARRNIACTYPTISHRGQHSRLKSAARKVEHAHAQAAEPYSPQSASASASPYPASDRADSASPGADADGVRLAQLQYRGGRAS